VFFSYIGLQHPTDALAISITQWRRLDSPKFSGEPKNLEGV